MALSIKLIAIALVAVVCVTAAGVYLVTMDNGGDDGSSISIVDGSGTTISLGEPLTSVVTANTNVPKAMKILGLEDELKGLSFYSAGSDGSNWDQFSPMFPNAVHMAITPSMSAEEVKMISDYVICPVSSMTVTAANQAAYENLGITVIRLDCYGDTALEDFEKLTILFGETEKVMSSYKSYLDTYNLIVDAVATKVLAKGVDDTSFLYFMNSSNWFYNHTSAGSQMIEDVHGTNALKSINGLDTTTVTNDAALLGIKEVVKAADSSDNIDIIFIRGATGTTTAALALTLWNGCLLSTDSIYSTLSAIGANSDGQIFVFNSNMMSGPLSYVGYVLIAEAFGIDTGLDPATLIGLYNSTYGFNEATSGLLFMITLTDGVASATQLA